MTLHPLRFVAVPTVLILWLLAAVPSHAQPLITAVTLQQDSVERYALQVIDVSLQAVWQNPYDRTEVRLDGVFYSPAGDSVHIPGFYLQRYALPVPDQPVAQGPPGWQLRFTPDQEGVWTFRIRVTDSTGSTASPPGSFFCKPSSRPGFVRGTTGNYFLQDNGKAFLTLGENLAWGDPSDKFFMYAEWMDSLAANGANFVKIMMVPWAFSIDWNLSSPGNYDNRQAVARHLDWVLELASERGIRVQLAFLIHDVLSEKGSNLWNQNPYNLVNGGPASTPLDFFTHPRAIELFQQRVAYTLARWASNPQIIAWEIFSEADNFAPNITNFPEVSLWLQTMNSFIRAHDPWKRPITAGYAVSSNDPAYWSHPLTSFTQMHHYRLFPDYEKELYIRSLDYMETYGKPFIMGEMGLAHNPDTIIHYDPEGIGFRNTLWTTLMSGALGSGMTWWWDNYIHPQDLYHHFRGPGTLLRDGPTPDSSWKAVRPSLLTDIYDTLHIIPGFDEIFMKAPENHFIVERGGILRPGEPQLGILLYGSGFVVNSFRNPPVFEVDYPTAGELNITTGNYVISSILRVEIDGIQAFQQTATANATYTVSIPPGRHAIRVENASTGNGACEIAAYSFHPYLSQGRVFALQGAGGGLGWIQHQEFHWPQWYAFGPPATVYNAQLRLTGLADTLNTIHWLDAWSGQLLSTGTHSVQGDTLMATVPPFSTDLAWYITPGGPAQLSESAPEPMGSLSIFPNPSIGRIFIQLELKRSGNVHIDAFDSSGRVTATPYAGWLPAGEHRLEWVPDEQGHPPGIYVLRARIPGGILSIKMIRQ